MYVCMYVFTHTFVCMYVCMALCTYAPMYMHIYVVYVNNRKPLSSVQVQRNKNTKNHVAHAIIIQCTESSYKQRNAFLYLQTCA